MRPVCAPGANADGTYLNCQPNTFVPNSASACYKICPDDYPIPSTEKDGANICYKTKADDSPTNDDDTSWCCTGGASCPPGTVNFCPPQQHISVTDATGGPYDPQYSSKVEAAKACSAENKRLCSQNDILPDHPCDGLSQCDPSSFAGLAAGWFQEGYGLYTDPAVLQTNAVGTGQAYCCC